MLNEMRDTRIQCPYCGETISVFIDCSVSDQCYIEDCQVCCRPIDFFVAVDPDGEFNVSVTHEDE